MAWNHITSIGISQAFLLQDLYSSMAWNHITEIGISQTLLLQELYTSMAWNHLTAIGISHTFLLQDLHASMACYHTPAISISKNIPTLFDFTSACDWDCEAAVERLPALRYSVDFMFLSFGIMGFFVEL